MTNFILLSVAAAYLAGLYVGKHWDTFTNE